MARGASITVENSFNRGLITEFTSANFPEQAATDADNVVFTEFGEVYRRDGMDFEPGYSLNTVPRPEDSAVVEYEWFAINNSGSIRMLVQQVGSVLHFFSVSGGAALSESKRPFTVNMNNYRTSGTPTSDVYKSECKFTAGRGYLFVTHPFCDPIFVEYNDADDTIRVEKISIQTRDIEGVDDGLEEDERPTTLSNLHKYNLLNQGWYWDYYVEDLDDTRDVLTLWRGTHMARVEPRDDYPSNADVWWLNKRIALSRDWAPEGTEIFDPRWADKYSMGNTPAPKGHYIYDAFYIDRSTKSGVSGLDIQSSGRARPSVCAFYAGRVWYAGVSANKYSTRLYFSQLVQGEKEFGRCYQSNDPTSETTFDIIDTDGGTIEIPLAEQVVALIPIKDSLLAVCSNGIYMVRGPDAGPFRATNYVVEFISNIGALNPKSIVVADQGLLWWAPDGIYAMTPDNVGLSWQVQSISKSTIQSFVEKVPPKNTAFIKGAYSKREQIARWIFSDDPDYSGYRYNRILEMRPQAPSFYPYTITEAYNNEITGIFVTSGQSMTETEVDLTTTDLEDITTVAGDPITELNQTFVPVPEVFKFTTLKNNQLTYSQLWRSELRDWVYDGGLTYSSFFVSGFRVRGDFLRKFNTTPVVVNLRNALSPSCIIRGVWDYERRFSSQQELYYRSVVQDYDYITRRLKIRGKGRSLQLRFDSTTDRPFHIVSWATFDTGGTTP